MWPVLVVVTVELIRWNVERIAAKSEFQNWAERFSRYFFTCDVATAKNKRICFLET